MALDFPANPTNGQAYGSYIYNGTIGAWQGREDSRTVAVLSPTVPATANPGDIWINTNDAITFVYYNDGTSSQWIEIFSSGTPFTTSKANLTGGNAFTGAQSITSTATTQVPLTINGIAAQTANLQEWKDSAGTVLSSIASNGGLTVSATGLSTTVGANSLGFSRTSTSYIDNVSIGGNISQRVSNTVASDTVVWNSSVNGLSVNPSGTLATTATPLTVKGTASQTADLQQWQNSGGTSLSSINSNGALITTAISDAAYKRVLNPAGGVFTTTTNAYTGAIRIVLPVGMTNNMVKFNISVYEYITGKSFDVVVAGYNNNTGTWISPSAYVVGNQSSSLNYTVRFGYTAGGKACIYIGETTSTWSYPQVAVNNVLLGYSASSSAWLSGWVVDFVTAFENVTQTINSTQVVGGLVPVIPTSATVGSGSATVASTGVVTFTNATYMQLNGCFNSSYENYRVVISYYGKSANSSLRFTTGGTPNTAASYQWTMLVARAAITTNVYGGAAATSFYDFMYNPDTNLGTVSMDVFDPYAVQKTGLSYFQTGGDSGFEMRFGGCQHSSTTQFDGFQIYALSGSGTFSGTVRVYGYR